jgi:antitoxin MazE
MTMKVAKWGNSLAVRLPASVVDALDLKEGDDVQIGVAEKGRVFEVEKTSSREDLIKGLRKYRGLMPTDFKFDRDELYERD